MLHDPISRILFSPKFEHHLRLRLPQRIRVPEILGRTWEKANSARVPLRIVDTDSETTTNSLTKWLVCIAINVAKDQSKAAKRRARRERVAAHGSTGLGKDLRCFPSLSGLTCPSAGIERRELRLLLRNAAHTAGLPKWHLCALWAWMRDRLAEWATLRGVKLSTAYVWAHRAREALRPVLMRMGFGPN